MQTFMTLQKALQLQNNGTPFFCTQSFTQKTPYLQFNQVKQV